MPKVVRKEIASFTVDPQILRELEKVVPRLRKSETVENLIIQFLKEKSLGEMSISSQAKTDSKVSSKESTHD